MDSTETGMRCGEREVRELVTCCDIAITGNCCHKCVKAEHVGLVYDRGDLTESRRVEAKGGNPINK